MNSLPYPSDLPHFSRQAHGEHRSASSAVRRGDGSAMKLDDVVNDCETEPEAARGWYVRHLQREPSLVAAAKWLAGEKLEHEEFHGDLQRALDHAVKPLTRYRCAACGFEAKQHFWQCPGCQAWDSYPPRRVEEL